MGFEGCWENLGGRLKSEDMMVEERIYGNG